MGVILLLLTRVGSTLILGVRGATGLVFATTSAMTGEAARATSTKMLSKSFIVVVVVVDGTRPLW